MASTSVSFTEMQPAECWQRLREADPAVGRLGFLQDQHPIVLPVNYAVDGEAVVVRFSGDTVLDDVPGTRVAFEVDEVEPAWEQGWSVLIQGLAKEVVNEGELARIGRLPLRAWAASDRVLFLRIDARHGISGRIIRRL